MKKHFILIALFLCSIVLTGCPEHTTYPLSATGDVINTELVGTWTSTDKEADIKKVRIQASGERSYDVLVLEQDNSTGEYPTQYKGWLTKLDGYTFLILQEKAEDGLKSSYYAYQVKPSGKRLITYSVDPDGTDAISSISDFRTRVKDLIQSGKLFKYEEVWEKR